MIKKIYGKKVYLAKIKDSYIFDKDSHKSHFYICLKDRNGKIKLRGLTHLYKPDSRRMGQLRGGLIYKRKFFNFDAVSGVNKKIIFNDING